MSAETPAPTPAAPLEGVRVQGDVTVAFQGPLDTASTPAMRAQLEEAISLRPARVVVDLSACPFVDAQGIAILRDAHRRCWEEERGFVLRGCTPRVMRLLALAGLNRVFAFE